MTLACARPHRAAHEQALRVASAQAGPEPSTSFAWLRSRCASCVAKHGCATVASLTSTAASSSGRSRT